MVETASPLTLGSLVGLCHQLATLPGKNAGDTEGKRWAAPFKKRKMSPCQLCKLHQQLLQPLHQHYFCYCTWSFATIHTESPAVLRVTPPSFRPQYYVPPSQGILRHLANMSESSCSLWPVLLSQQKPKLCFKQLPAFPVSLGETENIILLNKLLCKCCPANLCGNFTGECFAQHGVHQNSPMQVHLGGERHSS